MVSHQLQPWGIGVVCEVLSEVPFTDRFENTGVGELITGEDAKKRDDVCVRQATADEGMTVESLHSSGQLNVKQRSEYLTVP